MSDAVAQMRAAAFGLDPAVVSGPKTQTTFVHLFDDQSMADAAYALAERIAEKYPNLQANVATIKAAGANQLGEPTVLFAFSQKNPSITVICYRKSGKVIWTGDIEPVA